MSLINYIMKMRARFFRVLIAEAVILTAYLGMWIAGYINEGSWGLVFPLMVPILLMTVPLRK